MGSTFFSHLKGTISKPWGAPFYANCRIFRELGIQREPSFHQKAVGSWVTAGMTAGLGRVCVCVFFIFITPSHQGLGLRV